MTSRREFLKLLALGSAGAAMPWARWARAAGGSKPNILYILADDLGIADVNAYGQRIGEVSPREILTPNIDQTAAEGILFTQHYAGNTVCAPSRCALLTGKHTGHCYVRGNKAQGGYQIPLPDGEYTIGEMLQGAGYVTGCVGKWGLGGPTGEGRPDRQGFDYYYGYLGQTQAHYYYPNNPVGEYDVWEISGGVAADVTQTDFADNAPGDPDPDIYSHDVFTTKAKQFIANTVNDPLGKPFFLYLAYTIPHMRIEVPEIDPAYESKAWTDNMKRFASMITRMDADIGEIMTLLTTLGVDNDTLVVVTSDNGPHSEGGHNAEDFDSNGIYRGKKRDLYEGGIHMPMIARWPGRIAPGTTTDHISAFWDVMPTFAELTGALIPSGIDGISFLPTLLGLPDQQPQHTNLYWEFHEQNGKQAVRQGKWKAVRLNVMDTPPDPIELYDLEADPSESNDLAAFYPEKIEEFGQLMLSLRVPSAEFPFPIDREVPIEPPQDATGALHPIDYARGIPMDISGYTGASDLADFPLLVRLSSTIRGFSYGDFADPGGGDLRFTAADGRTLLSHEIEKWDPAGTSWIWVKVPRLAVGGARIFAYYGNPHATTAPAYATNGAVWWPSQQRAVFHLNNSVADSTAYGRVASDNGSANASPGVIADARAFDRTAAHYLSVAYNGIGGMEPRSVSAWIKTPPQAGSEVKGVCSWGVNSAGEKFTVRIDSSGIPGALRCEVSGGYVTGSRRVDDNQWRHVAVVLPDAPNPNATDLILYVDGEAETLSASSPQAIDTAAGGMVIGASIISGRTFDGQIDEVRIAAAAHSADWIKACYENQKPDSSFVAYGAAVVLTPSRSRWWRLY